MKKWWQRKREGLKRRSEEGKAIFFDFIIEILFWIPELLILPIRLLFWVFKGLGRVISHILDIT
jgi:hypothetical protein